MSSDDPLVEAQHQAEAGRYVHARARARTRTHAQAQAHTRAHTHKHTRAQTPTHARAHSYLRDAGAHNLAVDSEGSLFIGETYEGKRVQKFVDVTR